MIDEDSYQSLLSQHIKSKAQVALAKAVLDQAQYYFSRHLIKARMNGVVSERLVDFGEVVSPNMPVLRMVSDQPYYLRFGVSDLDLAHLKIGDMAEVKTESLEDTIKARITRIAGGSALKSGLFSIELELLDVPEGLKPGMMCQIYVKQALRESLMVPTDYLMNRNRQYYVYRLESQDHASQGHWIWVVPNTMNENDSEIISGLSEGDVLLFPQNAPIPPAEL